MRHYAPDRTLTGDFQVIKGILGPYTRRGVEKLLFVPSLGATEASAASGRFHEILHENVNKGLICRP